MRLLPRVESAYNNAKYTSTGYILFELNYRYHPYVSYKEDIDARSTSKQANELTKQFRNLMVAYRKNLQHAQKLQKQAHDKGFKLKSYAPSKKVWLNSKYTKTKCNWKWKVKFFKSFRVLHPVSSQAYKLELLK